MSGKDPSNDSQHADLNDQDDREEWELQRDSLKLEGDAFYKAKDFKQAILKYSGAIELDPENHILYSNRSAAHLNNSEKSKSLKDAQKCVELKKDWFKGQNRLGAALFSLGRLNEARSVYMESLKLQPEESNPTAKKAIDDIKVAEQEKIEQAKRQREIALATASGYDAAAGTSSVTDEKHTKEKSTIQLQHNDNTGEDDLLGDFFSSVEKESDEENKAVITPCDVGIETTVSKIKIENVDLGSASDQISRLLASNYQWKNLNPYNVLSISHEATDDEVARRYKALSLLLHPDKCKHPRAQEAFEEIRKANTALKDDDRRKHIRELIRTGMKNGKKEWELEQRRLSSLGCKPEQTIEEMQRKAVMKLFAEIEMKRRDVEKRKMNQEKRERDQEDAEKEKARKEMEFDKNWKGGDRLNNRVGNWRDFQGGSNKKRKK